MSTETVTLVHDTGSLELSAATLLVGLDDTGHDEFAPGHRVFGLGGCACLVGHYGELIDDPWRRMKSYCFSGPDVPMHAASLRSPTPEQLEALGTFFSRFPFFRFAIMAAESVENKSQHSLLKIVGRSVLDRIAEICAWAQPTDVAIVLENSERIEKDVISELSAYRMGDGEIEFQPKPFLLPKTANASILQVADFIIQAAGAQVRNRLQGKIGVRKDFEAVFYSVDRRLSYYVELLKARDIEAEPVIPADPQTAALRLPFAGR